LPLWQVFHPKGAYTAEDKQGLAERITGLFTSAPMPAFYVVVVFIEMSPDNYFVGATPTKNFVRFKVDQMANTFPSQLAREWWMRHVQHAVAPATAVMIPRCKSMSPAAICGTSMAWPRPHLGQLAKRDGSRKTKCSLIRRTTSCQSTARMRDGWPAIKRPEPRSGWPPH